jgi:hypothetical protein
MADLGDNSKPEFHAGFLYLIDLATGFRDCTFARKTNNIQQLVRTLESLALALTGYYPGADKQQTDIREKIKAANLELDNIMRIYEIKKVLMISEKFKFSLYDIELELRKVWKESGLQMRLKNYEDNSGEDFA